MECCVVLKCFIDDLLVIEELFCYNVNSFDFSEVDEGFVFLLMFEGYVSDW